ncbi:MAG: VOC family protein [Proteobacteria bacterium]|nr:VOC family protein [Pseudomonadota bacterium]
MIGFDLDHLGLATHDLDRASDVYARLGFTLTRKSTHQGPVPPHGETGPWGSGNYCIMLKRGYFELIGVTDPSLPHPMVAARLEKYAGLHIIALGCRDGDAQAAALRERMAGVAEPYDLVRDVPYGAKDGDTREGRFRIYQIDEEALPEGDCFLIEHRSRDVLWQPDLMEHANRVSGLAGVTICVGDADQSRARFAALCGEDGDYRDGVARFDLAAGSISLLDEAALGLRFPGVAPPCLPWVAAVTFAVDDRQALTGLLEANGVAVNPGREGAIWIAPDQGEGAVIEFT